MLLLHWLGVIFMLASAGALIAWLRGAGRNSASSETVDAIASRSTLDHLNPFFLGIFWILLFVAGLVLVSGALYPWLQDRLFAGAEGPQKLDVSDLLSILSLLAGVPLAFAGSIYAIYLAILGLRGSSDQKRLAEQANKFSDPAYELSQRAYNGYRRFGFLVGALLASSRIERLARDNAAYEGQAAAVDGAASEIVNKLHELLFDEAFSVAALEAAKSYGRSSQDIDEQTAEHQLRSAFAHLIGLLEDAKGRALDAGTMPHLMAGVYGLDLQVKRGRQAVVDEFAKESGSIPGDDDRRFLSYLAKWMGRVGDAETGRDLQRNARMLFDAERHGLTLDPVLRAPDELVRDCVGSLLNKPAELGFKTSRSVPVAPAVRIRAGLGDFQTIDQLQQVAAAAGRSAQLEVCLHPFNELEGSPDQLPAGFHVLSCSSDNLEAMIKRLPLRAGFRGVLIVDGIRSEAAVSLERRTNEYEKAWDGARGGDQAIAIPTRPTVLLDVAKNVTPADRISRSNVFIDTYGEPESGEAARLLLVGIDYFEFRPPGHGAGREQLLRVDQVFAQQAMALTDELKEISGL